MNKIIRNFIITLTLVGLMIFTIFNIKILPNAKPLFKIGFFNSNYLNETFVYQVTTLLLSFVIILITAVQTKFQSLSLLSITKIDGNINPEPWIGITKNNKDTWKKLGINLAVVISIVTAITVYFQVFRAEKVQSLTVPSFLLVVVFALINSFVEEVTFRHTFVSIVEYHKLNRYISQGLSAIIFGFVHYFGVPAKIPGVLLAGFLGWLLSKTIHETKGFFWAWLIHFLQDIIIMTALFMTLQ
ncbi:MAG: CPBP family intramembrane metalloprotease [Treponema sp.]|nr:CPBP family intramembrane metalloprotease [Treponema sp.]